MKDQTKKHSLGLWRSLTQSRVWHDFNILGLSSDLVDCCCKNVTTIRWHYHKRMNNLNHCCIQEKLLIARNNIKCIRGFFQGWDHSLLLCYRVKTRHNLIHFKCEGRIDQQVNSKCLTEGLWTHHHRRHHYPHDFTPHLLSISSRWVFASSGLRCICVCSHVALAPTCPCLCVCGCV